MKEIITVTTIIIGAIALLVWWAASQDSACDAYIQTTFGSYFCIGGVQ